jgi:hypothetical protein
MVAAVLVASGPGDGIRTEFIAQRGATSDRVAVAMASARPAREPARLAPWTSRYVLRGGRGHGLPRLPRPMYAATTPMSWSGGASERFATTRSKSSPRTASDQIDGGPRIIDAEAGWNDPRVWGGVRATNQFTSSSTWRGSILVHRAGSGGSGRVKDLPSGHRQLAFLRGTSAYPTDRRMDRGPPIPTDSHEIREMRQERDHGMHNPQDDASPTPAGPNL